MSRALAHRVELPSLEEASLPTAVRRDIHYLAIAREYGTKTTARSKVPLINHIDEGLYILSAIGSTLPAKQAYCLHPLVQGDGALCAMSLEIIRTFDRWPLMLAVEYRNIANAYLSTRNISSIEEIVLSPLKEVQDMLVADKIQNRKDFETYHKDTHPRNRELTRYFQNWFARLGINEDFYCRMVDELREGKHLASSTL